MASNTPKTKGRSVVGKTVPKSKARRTPDPPVDRTVPTPAPTSEVVMEPAAPRKAESASPERMFELFAEADKRWPGQWVKIARYGSSHGYRIKRAIERGEVLVPGGPDAWEVKATGSTQGYQGKVRTELYARRIDHPDPTLYDD